MTSSSGEQISESIRDIVGASVAAEGRFGYRRVVRDPKVVGFVLEIGREGQTRKGAFLDAAIMVSMNLHRAESLLDIQQLTNIVIEKILPSLGALKNLQSQGKILAGGCPVGQHYVVLFVEAESEDEVRELLGKLPFRSWGT